ncbi:MAG: hypothetical protein NZM07_10530, partial [Elioraea sp.]|nr:hypothetical protein [Elioraea sp.]
MRVNTHRFDRSKAYAIRVKTEGRCAAGVLQVGAPKRDRGGKHRKGGDLSASRRSPGPCDDEAIALARGVTHGVDRE